MPVETRRIPLEDLRVQAPRIEELTTIEASLRLDAVASAGFRMSRSKMTDLCKAGALGFGSFGIGAVGWPGTRGSSLASW